MGIASSQALIGWNISHICRVISLDSHGQIIFTITNTLTCKSYLIKLLPLPARTRLGRLLLGKDFHIHTWHHQQHVNLNAPFEECNMLTQCMGNVSNVTNQFLS